MFSQEPSSDVVTSLENLDGVIEKAVAIAVDEFKKGDDDERGGRGGGGGRKSMGHGMKKKGKGGGRSRRSY